MSDSQLLISQKILIVDDEPDVLDTLEDLLIDCDVTRAAGFEEARLYLESGTFDLAVLDIMGVDGYELLKIANQHKVTAVMLTAHALSPENLARSYREGAAYYIPKEEMVNIVSFLEEILEARQKGRSTWERWFQRLGSYCERHFGPNWQEGEEIDWKKFPFH